MLFIYLHGLHKNMERMKEEFLPKLLESYFSHHKYAKIACTCRNLKVCILEFNMYCYLELNFLTCPSVSPLLQDGNQNL